MDRIPFISSGMIISLIGFSGYLSRFYNHVAIGVEYLRNMIVAIVQCYLLNFDYIGIAFIYVYLLEIFI